MKLIKQVTLYFQEGASDKVYEVDLCEVGGDQFVVNFRYGRRGKSLRDGTKTAAPVSREAAEKIYHKLVQSKTDKGYRESVTTVDSGDTDPQATPGQPARPMDQVTDPRRRAIMRRLSEGHYSEGSWKLSRAVWRAGELRMGEAERLLLTFVGTGDSMLDYSIAAALCRCGSPASLEGLRKIKANESHPYHVRRIATEAMLRFTPESQRGSVIDGYVRQLPESLQQLAVNGPAEQFQQELDRELERGNRRTFAALEAIYFIDNRYVRPALLHVLRAAPLTPNYFQRLRRIFKTAELRDDGEVFGIFAYRVETTRGNFCMPGSWYFNARRPKPTVGPDADKAFSSQTRFYLRGRVWRTLQRLGSMQDSAYVPMAVEVLLAFTDQDAKEVSQSIAFPPPTYHQTVRYFDRYHGYWALSNILYGNSARYVPLKRRRVFRCEAGYEPGNRVPADREESFPELWDDCPDALLRLLMESRCDVVHQFAAKALRANESYCRQLDLGTLMKLLDAPYEFTCELGFDLAVARYDPVNPDRLLVLALANCVLDRARTQARRWIETQRSLFLQDTDFSFALITSNYADTRAFARECMRTVALTPPQADAVVGRVIAFLMGLTDDQGDLAGDVCNTLLRVFGQRLRAVSADVIRDLLDHPLAEVQSLAGEIVLGHETFSIHPPEFVLLALINADDATVRGIGVRIISQLSDNLLKENPDLLVALIRHPLQDIRNEIRPIAKRLADADVGFGTLFAARLVDALLVPGAPEGVPSHTAHILREDYLQQLGGTSAETVWTLLQSRSGPAQEIGGLLLSTNVDAESLSVEEIVKLASHDILSVREACWQMCRAGLDRLKKATSSAVRLLDAKWEDSRRFGFALFRDHFEDAELDPASLVSICDSVREDVQQFGREMITRRFQDEHGQEYLLKLSEHPSTALQLFATNFLDRFAADNPERLAELEPYFVSVLSRVNKARVAEDRVLRLLADESKKNEESARVVARIIARLSATCAVGDKARTLEMMVDIHKMYPQIELPIRLQKVEVR